MICATLLHGAMLFGGLAALAFCIYAALKALGVDDD